MKRLFSALVFLITTIGSAQTVVSYKFDPMAIRTDTTTPSMLEVETSGTVNRVTLDLLTGVSMPLVPSGSNRWSVSVPAAQLLAGYKPEKFNHNFIGFIRAYGPNPHTDVNATIRIVDSRVPVPRIVQKDVAARATPRILNVYRPQSTLDDVQAAVRSFYAYEKDDFDFVRVVFALPGYFRGLYGPRYTMVRNDVQGIGLFPMNDTATYGSGGKLKGIVVFPADNIIDCAESAFTHEIGHQWINYLRNPSLNAATPHWPPSTMAVGIIGVAVTPPTGNGAPFAYKLEMLTPTTAHITHVSDVLQEFTDLDLYLMGMLPAESVKPVIVVQGNVACSECVMPASEMPIQDIIATNGARVPDWKTAQRSFRVGTVVITRDRLLNDDEMAIFEYFAARGEATQPLQYTSGLLTGWTKPFYVTTRGRATVDLRLELPPAKHRSAQH